MEICTQSTTRGSDVDDDELIAPGVSKGLIYGCWNDYGGKIMTVPKPSC